MVRATRSCLPKIATTSPSNRHVHQAQVAAASHSEIRRRAVEPRLEPSRQQALRKIAEALTPRSNMNSTAWWLSVTRRRSSAFSTQLARRTRVNCESLVTDRQHGFRTEW